MKRVVVTRTAVVEPPPPPPSPPPPSQQQPSSQSGRTLCRLLAILAVVLVFSSSTTQRFVNQLSFDDDSDATVADDPYIRGCRYLRRRHGVAACEVPCTRRSALVDHLLHRASSAPTADVDVDALFFDEDEAADGLALHDAINGRRNKTKSDRKSAARPIEFDDVDYGCFGGCRCPAPQCVVEEVSAHVVAKLSADSKTARGRALAVHRAQSTRRTADGRLFQCVDSTNFLSTTTTATATSAGSSNNGGSPSREDELVCVGSEVTDAIPPPLPTVKNNNGTGGDDDADLARTRRELLRFARATSWAFKRWFAWGEGVPYGGRRRGTDTALAQQQARVQRDLLARQDEEDDAEEKRLLGLMAAEAKAAAAKGKQRHKSANKPPRQTAAPRAVSDDENDETVEGASATTTTTDPQQQQQQRQQEAEQESLDEQFRQLRRRRAERERQKRLTDNARLPRLVRPTTNGGRVSGAHSAHDGLYRLRNVCLRSEGAPGIAGFFGGGEDVGDQLQEFLGVAEYEPMAGSHARSREMHEYVSGAHTVERLRRPPPHVLDMNVLLVPVEYLAESPQHFLYRAVAVRNIARSLWGPAAKYHVVYALLPSAYLDFSAEQQQQQQQPEQLEREQQHGELQHAGDGSLSPSDWHHYGGNTSSSHDDDVLAAKNALRLMRRIVERESKTNPKLRGVFGPDRKSAKPAGSGDADGAATAAVAPTYDELLDDERRYVAATEGPKRFYQLLGQSWSAVLVPKLAKAKPSATSDAAPSFVNVPLKLRHALYSPDLPYTPEQLEQELFDFTATSSGSSFLPPMACFQQVVVAHVCLGKCSSRSKTGNQFQLPMFLPRTQADGAMLQSFRRELEACIYKAPRSVANGFMPTITIIAAPRELASSSSSPASSTSSSFTYHDPILFGFAAIVPHLRRVLQNEMLLREGRHSRLQIVTGSSLTPKELLHVLIDTDVLIGASLRSSAGLLAFGWLMPRDAVLIELVPPRPLLPFPMARDARHRWSIESQRFPNGKKQQHHLQRRPRSSERLDVPPQKVRTHSVSWRDDTCRYARSGWNKYPSCDIGGNAAAAGVQHFVLALPHSSASDFAASMGAALARAWQQLEFQEKIGALAVASADGDEDDGDGDLDGANTQKKRMRMKRGVNATAVDEAGDSDGGATTTMTTTTEPPQPAIVVQQLHPGLHPSIRDRHLKLQQQKPGDSAALDVAFAGNEVMQQIHGGHGGAALAAAASLRRAAEEEAARKRAAPYDAQFERIVSRLAARVPVGLATGPVLWGQILKVALCRLIVWTRHAPGDPVRVHHRRGAGGHMTTVVFSNKGGSSRDPVTLMCRRMQNRRIRWNFSSEWRFGFDD